MATSPAPAADELSTLREHLSRYRQVTLATLALVPDEKLDWRPGDNLRSFAEQLLHIAQVEDFYLHGLVDGDWDFARLAKPTPSDTRQSLDKRLRESQEMAQQKLSALHPSRLDQPVDVPDGQGGRIPVDWPLRGWLWFLVEHEVHHKAQLALYLRRVGVTPPFFAQPFPDNFRPDVR